MKILAVRIKNLASLEGETIIDFTAEPLQSAGIFAITGPTGAGKSTILDALCLALYAQTPRYDKSTDPNQSVYDASGNSITQSDPRGILRDGTGEGLAEVDFMGVDGQRYRSQWSVRRARNKPEGALQPYLVTCKNLDTDTDIQGTKTEILAAITKKVGLTFDQFTRAVLLAQGDFTAFLKADNRDKSELLEKLTGTQIYSEISRRVFEHHRQEKEELVILQVQKQGIDILSDEEIETLNKRRVELITIQQEQQKSEAALTKELSWHEQLTGLQKKWEQSTSDYDAASVAKKEAKQKEETLKQVEQVQPARVWIQHLAGSRQQFTDKEIIKENLHTQITTLREEKIRLEEVLKTARQNFDAGIKQQEDAQPLLNKAKELDVQLKERTAQQKTADTELTQIQETLGSHLKQITTQQQKSKELQSTIAELSAFVEQHDSRKTLAENHKLVLAGLTDAHKFLEEEQQIIASIQAVENILKIKQQEQKEQDKKLVSAKDTKHALAETYTQLQNAISGVDISLLQQEKASVDTSVVEIIQAAADWKTLSDVTRAYETIKATLQKNNKELKINQKDFLDTATQLQTAQTLKDAAARAWDIAKLAAAKDVVTLREQLSEGVACPVCGSTEHPYVDHDARLTHVLTELEEDFKTQELKYNETLQKQSTLQEKVDRLEKEISNLSQEQILKEQELVEYQQNWNRFSRHKETESLSTEDVSGWLKQILTEQQNKQQKLKERQEVSQKQQQELDKQRKRYDQAIEQQRMVEDQLKDIHRDLKSSQERLEQNKLEQGRSTKKLAEIRTGLTPYFTEADWFETWKQTSDAFIQNIRDFAMEWNAKTEKLSNVRNEQGILTATLQGLENQQQALEAEVAKKEQAVSRLKQQYDVLLAERKQIFGGQAVTEVEQQLKTTVDKAQQDLEQHKTAWERTQTEITRSSAQQEEVQKELQRLDEEIKKLDQNLTDWIKAYNERNGFSLEHKELETLLAFSQEWIEGERAAIHQIHTALVQSETVLKEHTTALQKHREQQLSDRTMETVAVLLAEAKSFLQETAKEHTETNLRLRQDADNREKAGTIWKQIEAKEKVVDNWAKLNQVIGSADGKKFRQVAQEYTLAVLLGYTNVQLDMLSKRYVLQRIPGSLGLQVVDQDMGNEVRSVNSLSGGESFLVSLALALGLASLSSSRMKVESLFIDEGFGSLDIDTLNVAMDALERLHNQGRKVGVISHVQEMTERIPVQIRVSKQQSGKSLVEVIGY
jgi:exonuclease SbcC